MRTLFTKRHEHSQMKAQKRKSKAPAKIHWPLEFLAADFRDARVLTWGYNSKTTRGYLAGSQGTIFSHARNLLFTLVSVRKRCPERPLVFIAHSLGGIIVKDVLRRSEIEGSKTVRQIFDSTNCVIFYGTPHRGSRDWASFGEGIAKVATSLPVWKRIQISYTLCCLRGRNLRSYENPSQDSSKQEVIISQSEHTRKAEAHLVSN